MRYYKVEFSNGYCSYDEEFIYQQEEDMISPEEDFPDFIRVYYTYAEGSAKLTIGTEEEVEEGIADMTDEDYMQNLLDFSGFEEITKEEYDELAAHGWEER